MFENAERINMTAAKMLTGKDAPISNMEMTLTNTFYLVRERFKQQQGKGKAGGGHRRR